MKLIQSLISLLMPKPAADTEGRVKCAACSNMVLKHIAESNQGLCGVCHRRKHPRKEPDPNEPSPYHRKLNTPVRELSDDDKCLQLAGSISWGKEERIAELFAVSTDFLTKQKRSRSWICEAVYKDCSLSILDRLKAAGCDPNAPSRDGSNALEAAIHKDRPDIVEWLLRHGTDVHRGRPLVAAVNNKSVELQIKFLTQLVEAGADVNSSYPWFGDEKNRITALDMAKSSEAVEFLTARGAKRFAEL